MMRMCLPVQFIKIVIAQKWLYSSLLYKSQCNTYHCDQKVNQPKPLYDLRFAPATKLKVMMQRRHAENAATSEAVINNLETGREGLQIWNYKNKNQHWPLPGHQCNHCQGRTQGIG